MYWSPFSNEINSLLISLDLIQDIYTNNDSWGQEILVMEDDNFCVVLNVTAEEMIKVIFPYDGQINKELLSELIASPDHNNSRIAAQLIDSCNVLKNIDLLYEVFINTTCNKVDFLIDYKYLIVKLYNIIHSF